MLLGLPHLFSMGKMMEDDHDEAVVLLMLGCPNGIGVPMLGQIWVILATILGQRTTGNWATLALAIGCNFSGLAQPTR